MIDYAALGIDMLKHTGTHHLLGCPNFFGLLCKLWIKITRYFRMRERGKVLSNMNAKNKDAGAITHCTGGNEYGTKDEL